MVARSVRLDRHPISVSSAAGVDGGLWPLEGILRHASDLRPPLAMSRRPSNPPPRPLPPVPKAEAASSSSSSTSAAAAEVRDELDPLGRGRGAQEEADRRFQVRTIVLP